MDLLEQSSHQHRVYNNQTKNIKGTFQYSGQTTNRLWVYMQKHYFLDINVTHNSGPVSTSRILDWSLADSCINALHQIKTWLHVLHNCWYICSVIAGNKRLWGMLEQSSYQNRVHAITKPKTSREPFNTQARLLIWFLSDYETNRIA